MEKVKKDDIIKVTVTGVQKYGAFAQSEDYDGLIHISEISYGLKPLFVSAILFSFWPSFL